MIPDVRDFMETLAHAAGDIIRAKFRSGFDVTIKADSSPLTEADTAINSLVLHHIEQSFPDHSFIGEEGSRNVPGSSYTWICDPIDGTVPFSLGIPISVFLLALCFEGRPIAAVAYDPYYQRLFYAEKGQGCLRNGQPLAARVPAIFPRHICVESPGISPLFDPGRTTVQLLQDNYRVTIFCSFAASALTVLEGNTAAAIFGGTSPWDGAALALLLSEAGYTVTSLLGEDQRFDKPAIDGLVVGQADTVAYIIKKLALR